MSSPPAICPQCFREIPRTTDDPDGSWEKCADCDGIFLIADTKIPKPEKHRVDIRRERDRIVFRCPSRTSHLWRLPLALLTSYVIFVFLVGCGSVIGLVPMPHNFSPFALLIVGWLAWKLSRSLRCEENIATILDCDGDTLVVRRGMFFFRWTMKIPMTEIGRLESKPLKPKEPENERELIFHYTNTNRKLRTFTIFLTSQAEENWVLDELHEFLKTTSAGSPMVPFAQFANHPSESLMVRPIGDSLFVQIFCRRCGMKIPAADLDLAKGEAVCRQKNCGERFDWWDIPPDPEPTPEELQQLRDRYHSYSDVRAFHFSDVINPFTSPFQPRNPIPLSSLRMPRLTTVSRPAFSLDADRFLVRVSASKPFGIVQKFFFALLGTILLISFSSMLFAVFMGGMILFERHESTGVFFGVFFISLVFGVVTLFSYWTFANYASEFFGKWTITINSLTIQYCRRFLWNRSSSTIPLEKLTGFYVVRKSLPSKSIFEERIANHLIRFDVGKKSYYFPCGSEEHRNWIASEIVDYLAVQGWDAGNGVVHRIPVIPAKAGT